MKLNCIIVEDNTAAASKLNFLLSEIQNVNVLQIAHSYRDGIIAIKSYKPDLVFMDYELDTSSGMELLNECNGFYQLVIFTTAYNNYVLDSFKFNVVDYLLKPICKEVLQNSVEKAAFYLQKNFPKSIISNNNQLINSSRTFYLPINNSYKSISIDEIIYLESDSNYTNIHLSDLKYKASKTLSHFVTLLNNYSEFIRIHKSFLINSKYISEIHKGIKSKLILKNGIELPISNLEKAEFFKMLGV